uniref:Uncharacterized protein n=1 Tax=Picea sitchensis TaxID=3332 RepID=D5ABH3_PICSI|nr:unknown [Picea sitchensis]
MMVLRRVFLSRPSLDISSNGVDPFSTTWSVLQSAFNSRGFHGWRFLWRVLIPRPPPPVLRSKQLMSIIPTPQYFVDVGSLSQLEQSPPKGRLCWTSVATSPMNANPAGRMKLLTTTLKPSPRSYNP